VGTDIRERNIDRIKERILSGGRLFIYGSSETAMHISQYLKKHEICDVGGYLVDDAYYDLDTLNGLQVMRFSEWKKQFNTHDVVVFGFASYTQAQRKLFGGDLPDGVLYVFFAFPYSFNQEDVWIDYDYYNEHVDEFENMGNHLMDERSREIYKTYISSQMTGDIEAIQKYSEINQYFADFMPDGYDVFIDIGGYTGDTLIEAKKQLRSVKRYVVFEPDEDNIAALKNNIDKYSIANVQIIEKGAYETSGTLSFSSDGFNSSISEDGDEKISVCAPDDVIHLEDDEKKVLIKMDIDGSEVYAIRGAKKLIKENNPYLAICVYHKRDDLITIPHLLDEISNNGYNYYLRYYGDNFRELVLYAIPQKQE
jgi:FkbM family methyltransferase